VKETVAHESMSDRAGSDPTTESQRFLQHRVAQFGKVAGLAGLAFWVFNLVGYLPYVRLATLYRHGTGFHLLGAASLLAVWALCRGRPRSRRFVHGVEGVGLMGSAIGYSLMGAQLPLMTLRPDYIVVLAMCFGMMVRAVFVPSPPVRTAILTALVGVPVVVGNSLSFQRESFAVLQQFVPEPLSTMIAVESSAWWLLTVAVCTVTSKTLYGLRREVREARQLGQYLLEEKLGEGGMGVVYRARHAMLRRPTAVKLLPADKSSESTVARFEREVRLTARLAHPNTVTVYDYGRTPEGVFYYAMELLEGANLREVVDVGGPLPPARVLHVLEQVAASPVEAPGIGLIHRDIKPANILLCEIAGAPDVAKVVDFGLVKEVERGGDASLTTAGTLTGTPLYMAPEAITAPETLDARSDLYSLGTVGYYLLVGADVFTGRSVVEICGHHLHSQPAPPSERTEDSVPPDLEALLLSCLAKSPAERPDGASDLLRRLRACEDSGTWTDEAAREWWGRHAEDLAERQRATTASVSGRSLVIDLAGRGETKTPRERPSMTSTAPPGSGWAGRRGQGKGDAA
jgi:serine/threonine-protein kinase